MKMLKAVVLLALTMAACGGQAPADDDVGAEVQEELGVTTQAHQQDAVIRRVTLSTGVTLSYLEQGSRHGDPVIFLHGYSDSHRSFDLNLPLVVAALSRLRARSARSRRLVEAHVLLSPGRLRE